MKEPHGLLPVAVVMMRFMTITDLDICTTHAITLCLTAIYMDIMTILMAAPACMDVGNGQRRWQQSR